MVSAIKILLVDDEEDVLEFLEYSLRKENFIVMTAKNGLEALKVAKAHVPNIILLDRMMPEMNGIEACKQLRAMPELKHTKIVFLTARTEEQSQIEGLESGADDYISKPIRSKLLIAKLHSIIRSTVIDQPEMKLSYKNITIDRSKYLIFIDDQEIVLPRKEFELFALLLSMPDHVFRREEILAQVWGKEIYVGDRTIDVHIRKLREKIGEKYFATVKGIGYKFVAF